ncbi:MAG: DUF2905 domain-containing protein [Thermodesulfobacteriota bacterium]|nr:DUF2905 domain-containing protein [Thermodesulfobacteriota bacterium]
MVPCHLEVFLTMNPLSGLGKVLIVAGLVMAGLGLLLVLTPKVPWLGRVPGDIVVKKENFRIYFPITTCIIVSLVLTILLYLFKR